MGYQIQEMTIEDYDQAYALWRESRGIRLTDADTRENVARLLACNPGLSFVVRDGDELVGAVLCSQDGRVGYLTHLVVDRGYRRQGLGRALVGRCLYALMRGGISRCNLLIMEDDPGALAFWQHVGLSERVDLVMLTPRGEG